MTYDNYGKLVEKIILKLYELRPTSHLKYAEIKQHFSEIEVSEIKECLTHYEYSSLFDTECECRQGAGMDDMYLLSIEAKRLIEKAGGWKGYLLFCPDKPIKWYNRVNSFSFFKTNILVSIPVLIALVSLFVNYLQYQTAEKSISKEDSTTKLKKELDSLKKYNFSLTDSLNHVKQIVNKNQKQTDTLKK